MTLEWNSSLPHLPGAMRSMGIRPLPFIGDNAAEVSQGIQ